MSDLKDQITALQEQVAALTAPGNIGDAMEGAELRESLLQQAGFMEAATDVPAFMDLVKVARQAAVRQAAVSVVTDEDEEDDQVEDRGRGAQAELPTGVPDWPPRPFLAREKTYTKAWQKHLLRQGENVRTDSDPRMAEGDCMSNVVLWLDFATICNRLTSASFERKDYVTAEELHKMANAYVDAAYEASRMRVDEITMYLLNRGAVDLYRKTTALGLETTNMRAPGLRFLRQANAAMLTARAKAVATKAAATVQVEDVSSSGVSGQTRRGKNTPNRTGEVSKAGTPEPNKSNPKPPPAPTKGTPGQGA